MYLNIVCLGFPLTATLLLVVVIHVVSVRLPEKDRLLFQLPEQQSSSASTCMKKITVAVVVETPIVFRWNTKRYSWV